jgi:hypothetical protein
MVAAEREARGSVQGGLAPAIRGRVAVAVDKTVRLAMEAQELLSFNIKRVKRSTQRS